MRTGSPLNAFFKGRHEAEFTLFSALASLPLVSMDAARAARQIVRATKRGEAERILSVPANVLARFHGLFPGLTADLLGAVNRVLPAPAAGTGDRLERGMEVYGRVRWPLLDALMAWTLSAARRFHQYPGPRPALPRAQYGAHGPGGEAIAAAYART
jgi:hypothetical protein